MRNFLFVTLLLVCAIGVFGQARTADKIATAPFTQLTPSMADGDVRTCINCARNTTTGVCTSGTRKMSATKLNGLWMCTDYTDTGGGGGGGTRVEREIPTGAINDANTSFVIAVVPTVGSEEVFWNGQLLTVSVDYTISGAIISAIIAPHTGDDFVVSYETATTTRVVRETPSGAVNGTNPTFVLAGTPRPGREEVFLNGWLMTSAVDYTISGATITMITIPETGDYLRVSYVP